MSGYSFNAALEELEAQINNCEQDLIRFIEEKRMVSDKSMSIDKMNRHLKNTPIAIIGMASLFPQARNLHEYWQNIVNKIDCITDIPESHWSVEDYYDPAQRNPEDKTYCKRGGFIPHVDFNPMEFGIPPSILEVTDVSQLLSLVIAKEAMEDAGYGEKSQFNHENTGVVLGSAALKLGVPLSSRLQYPIWKKVLKSSGLSDKDTQRIIEKIQSAYVKWDENAFPGMLSNVVSGRIANRLNLGGLNCTVDAACASSLAALKMAIGELVEHRCDMMLSGGVDTDNSINAYISFSKTPAVTPSDKVKPFDSKSDGMMLGEGIGILVLKRLEDAVRDEDRIYAVIKGIGTSSDGRYKSIYAPRKEGQVKALERAYKDAGFAPESVGLIEAHGTGTMAGDPTEFSSLQQFFSESDRKKQHIALGSVKSQIGHTKAAAGAASLIKTALALHHKVLPPTINVDEPNPKLDIKNSSFYLNTQTRPWIRAEGEPPRRAGVSSFGFGGTNYHVVLEEYEAKQENAYRLHQPSGEVILFAETPAKLVAICQENLTKLQSETGKRDYAQLLAESRETSIPLEVARVGFVADSLADACKLLKTTIDLLNKQPSVPLWEHPQGIFYRRSGIELAGKVVALFSGQGSQYLEMGRELVMNFPELGQLYGYMDNLLLKDNLRSVSEIVFPRPVFEETEENAQITALQRTEYAQPAIGMLSAGLYKILQKAGFKSDFVAGHSFGELTALWAAGVLSEEDYCFLVKARGQAMAAPQDPNYDSGAMLAVKEELNKVEAVLKQFPRVTIANLNSPRQVVLAGSTKEIERVQKVLHDSGCVAVLLPVSAAFHTSLIAFAQKSFAIATKSVEFKPPQIPVYTNVTGKQYSQQPAEIQKNLENHLANSVLFKQEIENIYKQGGYCFVEFGPRKILTNLVKDILGENPHIAIALNPSPRKSSDKCLREAFVQLRVVGLPLKNLDPYQLPEAIPAPKNKKQLSVSINGSNYVSPKTKQAFTDALQDGHKVQLEPTQELELSQKLPLTPKSEPSKKSENTEIFSQIPLKKLTPVTSVTSEKEKAEETTPESVRKVNKDVKESSSSPSSQANTPENLPTPVSEPAASKSKMEKPTPNKQINYQQILESLEYVLEQFQQNQSENLQVHGHYLNHQVEYVKTFFQLMQQHNDLLAQNNTPQQIAELKSQLMESLERSMMQFHSQQGDTLRVHEEYLNHQTEYTKNFFQLIQQEYARLISDEASGETSKFAEGESVIKLDNITSRKDISSPSTHKIWEISSPKEPEPHPLSNKKVSEPRDTPAPAASNGYQSHLENVGSIENVVDDSESTFIQEDKVESEVKPELEDKIKPEVKPILQTLEVQVVPSNSTNTATDVGQTLLSITSEKTGYPVEMLELDMDMEADLGIDSIKRVEILGAMQEMYPDLPQANLEELGEKRTIGEIVEFLQAQVSRNVSVEIALSEVKNSIPQESETTALVTETQTSDTADIPTPPIETVIENDVAIAEAEIVTTTASEIEIASLAQTLLEITSEKTGYPVEMLELEMDMEADLGIDSIKRVEILGAMQDKFPDLPQGNVEDIGELRTIGQIVEYMEASIGGEKKKPQHNHSQQLTKAQITKTQNNPLRRQVKLKVLPKPDFLNFQLPEGHIALITDDGSLTTSKLVQSLIDFGWKIVVLSFPQSLISQQSPLPTGVTRITLEDLSEQHLQQQLKAIAINFGKIGTFIHLHPVLEVNQNGRVSYLEEEKAIIKQVFLIAKHLKKSLNQTANNGRSCFCTVARLDGAFGLEQQVSFGPIAAGLFGLTKTLNWEWGRIFCRAIDLDPEINAENSAQYIRSELHDPNRYITEVAYGRRGRVTLISAVGD